MGDPQQVGTEFVKFYYQSFDSNRASLDALYTEQSLLTFEGDGISGKQAIMEKLVGLRMEKVLHQVETLDVQPSPTGLLVYVTGQLIVDDSPAPMKFSQVFHLLPNGQGSYFVQNDLFRLT